MKKLLAATAIFFALGANGSLANTELQAWCERFADSQGVPRTPCPCIVAAIGSDAELSAEMMTMATIEQYHTTGSAALRAVVDPCVPPRQQ